MWTLIDGVEFSRKEGSQSVIHRHPLILLVFVDFVDFVDFAVVPGERGGRPWSAVPAWGGRVPLLAGRARFGYGNRQQLQGVGGATWGGGGWSRCVWCEGEHNLAT